MIKVIPSEDIDVIISSKTMSDEDRKYHQKRYNTCLQEMLTEISTSADPLIREIFEKYDLSFSKLDDMPLVNIDFPEKRIGS